MLRKNSKKVPTKTFERKILKIRKTVKTFGQPQSNSDDSFSLLRRTSSFEVKNSKVFWKSIGNS